MDQQYIIDCTSEWSMNHREGVVELWEFFDKVEWKKKYAIKVNGVLKSVLEPEYGNPHSIFEVVKECF